MTGDVGTPQHPGSQEGLLGSGSFLQLLLVCSQPCTFRHLSFLELQWPRVHVPFPGDCLEVWRAAAAPVCRIILTGSASGLAQQQFLPLGSAWSLLISSSLGMMAKLFHLLVGDHGSSPFITPGYGQDRLLSVSCEVFAGAFLSGK